MSVVEIIAIRLKGRARAKEPPLWRHHRHLAAGLDLLDPQTALAFAPAIGDHLPICRYCGKTNNFSMVGELSDANVAGVNRGLFLAEKFVNPKCRRDYQCQYDDGCADQRALVPPRFRNQYRTGRCWSSGRGCRG